MKKTAILCLATLAFVAVATAQNHSHAQQPAYRARVILHTDTIRGPENRDNHVNRTFQLLQVIRKFNETHDLMVCFGLNGPNGMFGLRGWKLIPNTTTQLAHFPPNGHFVEISELVGPWHIRALHNPVGRSGQKFTGGFHGLINRETKKTYPSAQNLGFHYYADGHQLKLGQEVLCQDIKCVDQVKICTYNTFDKNTNTARFGILYSDTYTMKDDKIYLHATIEALEDVDIELHYGMQTCYFNPFIGFVTEQGTRETDTSLDTTRKDAQGLPLLVYGRKPNGLTLYVKMFNQGAMAGKRNGNKKAFSLSYGKANTKTYHWVYGNGTNGIMKKGDKNFYAGFFSISDQKPEQFLKDCR